MPKRSITKNYLLNAFYRVLTIIIPLITAPFLARTLGAEGMGQYSFTHSLNTYFVLLAALGFGNYAQREIARYQADKSEQTIIFYEVILLRLISVGIALGITFALAFGGVYQTYKELMLYWTLAIAAEAVDITFFFQGNEEFGKIVGRNLLVKILSVVLIFVLVRSTDRVWLYVVITGGGVLLGNLSIWIYLPKFLDKKPARQLQPFRHTKGVLKLFAPAIIHALYSVLDRAIIGIVIQDTYVEQTTQIIDNVEQVAEVTKRYADLESGYYMEADSIIATGLSLITAMGTVLLPRNSSLVEEGKMDEFHESVKEGANFVWFLAIPIAFGLAAISSNFLPWFLGSGFDKSVLLLQILSPLMVIMGLANVYGVQTMLPLRKDSKYALCVLCGAIVNIIVSVVLVYFFWSVGAAIGSVIAETVGLIAMAIVCRKHVSFWSLLKRSWKSWLAGAVMFGAVFAVTFFVPSEIWITVLLILGGCLIYFGLLFIFRDAYFLGVLVKAKRKLARLGRKQ